MAGKGGKGWKGLKNDGKDERAWNRTSGHRQVKVKTKKEGKA